MNYYLLAGLFCAASSVHAADVGVLIKPVPAAPADGFIICVESDAGVSIAPSHAELTKNPEDYIWLTPTYWLWLPDGMRRHCVAFSSSDTLLDALRDDHSFGFLFAPERTLESQQIWLSFVIKLLILRLPFCRYDLPVLTYRELPVFFGGGSIGLPSCEQLDAVARYLFTESLLAFLIERGGGDWGGIIAHNCSAFDRQIAMTINKEYIKRDKPYQNALALSDFYIKN